MIHTADHRNCLMVRDQITMRQFLQMMLGAVPGPAPVLIADAALWDATCRSAFLSFLGDFSGQVVVRTTRLDHLDDRFLSHFAVLQVKELSLVLGSGNYSDYLDSDALTTRGLKEASPTSVQHYMMMQRATWAERKKIETWGVL